MDDMSRLLWRIERVVQVDHSQFVIVDFDEASDEHSNPPLGQDAGLGVGERAVRVMSLIGYHEVELDFEVWDGEPGPGKVPPVGEVEILSRYGVATVEELFQGHMNQGPIALGAPGRYRVRVERHCLFPLEERWQLQHSGRDSGLEKYVVQTWRVGDLNQGLRWED